MNRFVQRAIDRLDRLDHGSVRALIVDIANQNDLLDMVMESMTYGLFVLDTSGRTLMHNRASARLIPLVPGDILERPLWEVIDDRDVAEFVREHLVRQERVLDRDFVLELGSTRIISLTLLPLVRSGTIHGSLISVEDVSDKRSNDARLRRAESLAALTTLTAGVAHEIKNPLASIGIHLQLMQKSVRGKESVDTGDISQYLEIVGEEVDRLNMIVVDYLMAVRPTDADLTLSDLNAVVREVTEFLQFELKEAGVHLRLEFSEIPHVLLDEKSLKQALLNLVKNAVAAMPDGGDLRIATAARRDRVELTVRDTGDGIPEQLIGKIFEPYFTTKDSSSGLGLTVVFKIVKEHRGEIAVSSRVGEGTAFTISFPVPQGEKRLIGYEGDD